MAKVSKGKPQKGQNLYIFVEVLKERSKCPKDKHFQFKVFCAYRANRNRSYSVFWITFIGLPQLPEHSFVIVFPSSRTLSLKVQTTFQSPCKNASPISLDRNSLFRRSTLPSHLLVSKRLCPNILESLSQNQLNFKSLIA